MNRTSLLTSIVENAGGRSYLSRAGTFVGYLALIPVVAGTVQALWQHGFSGPAEVCAFAFFALLSALGFLSRRTVRLNSATDQVSLSWFGIAKTWSYRDIVKVQVMSPNLGMHEGGGEYVLFLVPTEGLSIRLGAFPSKAAICEEADWLAGELLAPVVEDDFRGSSGPGMKRLRRDQTNQGRGKDPIAFKA